ncbi:DUF1189 domain-containing protein [Planctomycetota bacterium]
MKKFSIIHIPVLSFYSKELYRDVGLNWKGAGFAYLLLLLAVCWVPVMINVHMVFSDFVNNAAPAVVEQVPRITIADGEVSIEEPQPYYIKLPDSNDVLAVIDTAGEIESLEDVEDTNAILLLTKNKVIMRQSGLETRTYDLSEVKKFAFGGDDIMGWLRIFGKFFAIAAYPFALICSYVYRIIQALIYAAIGLLFASVCKVKLPYNALLRLAIAAVTPCIIVGTILDITGIYVPWPLYPLVALGYLFYGVKATSPEPPGQEEILRPQNTGI